MNVACVCGKGESLETCCGPYLSGQAQPATAEALMRARYSAYATGNVDYIIDTHDPETVKEVDRGNTELWSKSSSWLGLEILKSEQGQPEDSEGIVEFNARYKLRGVTVNHRERAKFRKQDGRWWFVDGQELTTPTVRREGPAIGRNDPCTCGSGKKYKKCCGAAARP